MSNKVLQYVIDKIDAAKIETDIKGFPYFSVEEVFPSDYYDKLVDVHQSIEGSNFKSLSKFYKNRFILDLNCGENNNQQKNNFKSLKSEEASFLKEFQDLFLTDNRLRDAFFRKYGDYIIYPFKDSIIPQCRLQRDLKGYKIGPHRDNLDKLFSVMFYTPTVKMTNELEQDHGTALCIPKFENPENYPQHPDHVGSGSSRHFRFEDVKIIKTAPAKANTLFSWAVSEKSYHGVTSLESEEVRSTIAYFAKTPKHLKNKHVLWKE